MNTSLLVASFLEYLAAFHRRVSTCKESVTHLGHRFSWKFQLGRYSVVSYDPSHFTLPFPNKLFSNLSKVLLFLFFSPFFFTFWLIVELSTVNPLTSRLRQLYLRVTRKSSPLADETPVALWLVAITYARADARSRTRILIRHGTLTSGYFAFSKIH